jgi:type IV pilus assembly protein PilC
MTFVRQLATLLDAGLPILKSLRVLMEQSESPVLVEVAWRLSRSVESGKTLAAAMAEHPRIFDPLCVSMVRVGEIGGVLSPVLFRVAEHLERRIDLWRKIRGAMIYPLTVALVASVITAFILWKVVPKIAAAYETTGEELPAPTQVLIGASELIREKAPWAILAVALIAVIVRLFRRTAWGGLVIDRLKLKTPLFGDLIRKVAIVRFTETLATLISAGVPILNSLDIVRHTAGNEVLARAIGDVHRAVADGHSIHEPLAAHRVFPPLVVHMVAVGEETGDLTGLLRKVAVGYQLEVDNAVKALTSIIEPLLIVLVGLVVGAIAVAVFLPIAR